MLENLKVLNGEMSLVYDQYVDIYTVDVDENVERLVFDLKPADGWEVEIINNDLTSDVNYVYLELKNGDELNTITLEVYKKISKTVINYEDIVTPVEVEAPILEYKVPLIVGCCTLTILIVFWLLFRKKKKRRKNRKK